MFSRICPAMALALFAFCCALAFLPACSSGPEVVSATKSMEQAVADRDVQQIVANANVGGDLACRDQYGWTPLMVVVKAGDEPATRFLQERGAAAGALDGDGRSVLYWAAAKGNASIVKLLLAAGADVRPKDKFGRAAVHVAVAGTIRLLADAGANVSEPDEDGVTALHMASKRGMVEEMEELLACGADVNARDKDGKTPMGHAGGWQNSKDLLLRHGGKE